MPASAVSAADAKGRIEEALDNALSLQRPRQVGLAAFFDGNKYVQCRRLSNRDIRCEAGGALMQPSLSHVLATARIDRLGSLGWRLDSSFGNYARSFAADTAPGPIAEAVLQAP